MEEIKKGVPKRRFKEFQNAGEWEERKLSELAQISTGFPFDSKEFDQNGNYLVITNGNIQNDSPTVDGHIGNRIKIESNDSRYEYILKKNDILVTMDGTVGRTAKVIGKQQILAQRVGRLTAKANPEFVYQFLNTGDFFDKMTLVSHGGTIKHISLNEIGNYENYVPHDDDEFKKIGELFQNLDSQITLQQRKLEKIKAMKKAYLSEMFPAAGQTKPKRRFKGFTEDWIEHEFKDDIVSIQTGTNLLGSTSNKGRPLLKMGNIQRGYFALDKLEKLNKNEEVEPENIAHYGDFLFNTRNTLELVGKGATWFGISNVYAFNSNLARFVFKNIDTVFFNYLYNTSNMIRQVNQRAMGTTSVAAIYPRTLNTIKYKLPLLPEQQKIGTFFKNLDKQITLHQKKLSKLQNLKKSYLNEMFI